MANASVSAGPSGDAMAYRPLTPPRGGFTYGSDDDEDDDRRRYKLRFGLHVLARLPVLPLALAAVGVWGGLGVGDLYYGDLIFLFIVLLLVVIWNLGVLAARLRSSRAVARMLPRIVCQFGDCSCVVNGDDDEDDDLNESRLRKRGGKPRQQRWKTALAALADLALGLMLIILTATSWGHLPYDWWSRRYLGDALLGLIITVGVLELLLVPVSLLPTLRDLVFHFEVGIGWKDGDSTGAAAPIRLPSDIEDRRTAGGSVSVSA